jgi:hypothetical protein
VVEFYHIFDRSGEQRCMQHRFLVLHGGSSEALKCIQDAMDGE